MVRACRNTPKAGKKMTRRSGRSKQPEAEKLFLQPLAVALACVVLGGLVLINGFINLRAIDSTMFGYLEQRARDVIGHVNLVTQYHFNKLERQTSGEREMSLEPTFSDESFSLQETLILDLVALAQSLDWRYSDGGLDEQSLRRTAENESLKVAALLDETGMVVLSSARVPPELKALAYPVAVGLKRLSITLFHRLAGAESGAVCVGRMNGGAVLLSLDMPGLRSRIMKVSARKAIDEVSGASGALYAAVTDTASEIVAFVGDPHDDIFENGLKSLSFPSPGTTIARRINVEDKKVLQVSAPLLLESKSLGLIHVGMDSSGAAMLITKMKRTVLASTALLIAVAFLSMWMLYRNQNRHLAKLREMQLKLDRAERLSALGGLAAGVAHEIRNPLNAISMAAQRLNRGDVQELTEVIRDEIRRLNEIVEGFLSFSRTGTLRLESQDLNEIVRQFVILVEEEVRSRGVELIPNLALEPVIVQVDADKLRQAMFNITRNALEAVSDQGKVVVTVERLKSGKAAVHIEDNGRGLTAEQIDHMFDPAFTTKEKGLGLGLSIAHEIIAGHGGEIRVESRPGKGSRFSILLP
jgi:signal transduction histidine kinase